MVIFHHNVVNGLNLLALCGRSKHGYVFMLMSKEMVNMKNKNSME